MWFIVFCTVDYKVENTHIFMFISSLHGYYNALLIRYKFSLLQKCNHGKHGYTFHHSYFLTSAVGGTRSGVVMETALFMPGDVRLLPVCSPPGHFSLIAWKQAKYENMKRVHQRALTLKRQQM